MDILYYPDERDEKGELIKAGHYALLIAVESTWKWKGLVYSLGDYVAVFSETTD